MIRQLGTYMKENNRNKFNFIGRIAFGAVMAITASFAVNAQDAAKADETPVKSDLVASVRTADGKPLDTNVMPKRRQAGDDDAWTGFYVGGYIGGGFGRADAQTTTVFDEEGYFAPSSVPAVNEAGNQRIKPNGFTGGVTFGGNKQFGALVLGVEADFGSLNTSDTVSVTDEYPCCVGEDFDVTQTVRNRWLFTARPRVGVAAGGLMVYGTGGLAVTDLKYESFFTDSFGATQFGEIEKTRAGWALGAGGEFKLGSKWSVKGEYLYTDFGRITRTGGVLDDGEFTWPENPFTHSTDLKMHNVRFGLNFHF